MAMPSCLSTRTAVIISKCSVKPVTVSDESKRPYYLTAWDLQSLNYGYGRFGIVFNQPDDQPIHIVVDQLKNSLATALTYFFPLSGRLVTENIPTPTPAYRVYVECNDSPGAEFIHAVAPALTLADLLTPIDVPVDILGSLFGLVQGTTNNHGHILPLLVVQLTQLVDGIFISFCISHSIADGPSFWHFINSYSEICRSTHRSRNDFVISRPPVTNPWFPNNDQCRVPGSNRIGLGSVTPVPSAYRQRIFHFTSKAIAHVKAKANVQYHTHKISSYQALAALIWRSATRARALRRDQMTTCVIAINSRSKLEPPLSADYFGNCLTTELVSITVDELLRNNLGWAAWMLHNKIISCDNNRVRSALEQFEVADRPTAAGDPGSVYLGSSPQLDVYGNNFGWGNPISVQSCGDLVDGYVHLMPGRDKGSADLIMCFYSKTMNALELDDEFMGALSAATLSKI